MWRVPVRSWRETCVISRGGGAPWVRRWWSKVGGMAVPFIRMGFVRVDARLVVRDGGSQLRSPRTPRATAWQPRCSSSPSGIAMFGPLLRMAATVADQLGRSLGGGYPGLFLAERARELRPAGNLELCVAAREVSLDGLQRDI